MGLIDDAYQLRNERYEINRMVRDGELSPEQEKAAWAEFERRVAVVQAAISERAAYLDSVSFELDHRDHPDQYDYRRELDELRRAQEALNKTAAGTLATELGYGTLIKGGTLAVLGLPVAIAQLFGFFIAILFTIGFFAALVDPLRSVLEAVFGDAVPERRREEGNPLLVGSIVAAAVAIVYALASRLRWRRVRAWLSDEVAGRAVVPVWFLATVVVVYGIGLVVASVWIASGEDLRDSEPLDVAIGGALLGILIHAAVLGLWSWWRTWWTLRKLRDDREDVRAIAAQSRAAQS